MKLWHVLVPLALIAVGGVVAWASLTQRAADEAQAKTVAAEQKAAGAELQANVSAGVSKSVDQLVTRERTISKGVSRETESVRLAFGEDGSIESVVAAWSDGIDRLRGIPEAGAAPDASVDRDTELRFGILHAQREAGEPAAWLAGYAEAEPAAERAVLRGRCDAAVERVCRARPLGSQAV